MAVTTWNTLINSTTCSALDVMENFESVIGSLAPMNSTGAFTTGVYDVGTSTARWSTGWFNTVDATSLTVSGVASIATANIAALNVSAVASIQAANIASLSVSGVASIATANITTLSVSAVASIQAANIASLSVSAVASIQAAHVATLSVSGVASITTLNVASLTVSGGISGINPKVFLLYNVASATIIKSQNVLSVTNNSTGDITVTFATATFSDANYIISGVVEEQTGTGAGLVCVRTGGKGTDSVRLLTHNASILFDTVMCSIMIFEG